MGPRRLMEPHAEARFSVTKIGVGSIKDPNAQSVWDPWCIRRIAHYRADTCSILDVWTAGSVHAQVIPLVPCAVNHLTCRHIGAA